MATQKVAYVLLEVTLDPDNGLDPEDDALLAVAMGQYTVAEVDILD